jgi:hypothetical protein
MCASQNALYTYLLITKKQRNLQQVQFVGGRQAHRMKNNLPLQDT